MTRDEALKTAWDEILSSGGNYWLIEEDDNRNYYSEEEYALIDKAISDILRHPTEYVAWIE